MTPTVNDEGEHQHTWIIVRFGKVRQSSITNDEVTQECVFIRC